MNGITRRGQLALAVALLVGSVKAQAQQHDSKNLSTTAAGQQEKHRKDSGLKPLVLQEQGSFYVGGQVRHTDATTGQPGGFFYPTKTTFWSTRCTCSTRSRRATNGTYQW